MQILPHLSTQILGLVSALFTIASLYAFGALVLGRIGFDRFGHHVRLAIGFGVNHLLFLVVSPILVGPWAIHVMNILHALALVAYLLSGRRLPFTHSLPDPAQAAVLLVLFLPYMFALVSPPMNVDGLNFYIPNVEWVFHRGLEFNPHLTAYTTMPMGVEYLYAQAFGLGGRAAIMFTCAIVCILTIGLAHSTARMILPPMGAHVFILAMLLIPNSFSHLFWSAKVDMFNTYLIFLAASMLLHPLDDARLLLCVVLSSIACAVKQLSWLQLSLPILACIALLSARRSWRTLFAACLLPVLFIGPVILKNQIQTGNPLAPVFWTPMQKVYIAPHIGEDLNNLLASVIEGKVDMNPVRQIVAALFSAMSFLLYSVTLLVVAFSVGFRVNLRRVSFLLVFLLLSSLSWHAYIGIKLQPTRFMLPFLMLFMLVILHLAVETARRIEVLPVRLLGMSMLSLLLLLNLANAYGRHGVLFTRFRDAQSHDATEWYKADGKYHYAMTAQMVDGRWIDAKVMYLFPLVLGVVPYSEMKKAPKDLDLYLNTSRFKKRVGIYEYILCSKSQRSKYGLEDREVVLQTGFLFLLKNKRAHPPGVGGGRKARRHSLQPAHLPPKIP